MITPNVATADLEIRSTAYEAQGSDFTDIGIQLTTKFLAALCSLLSLALVVSTDHDLHSSGQF